MTMQRSDMIERAGIVAEAIMLLTRIEVNAALQIGHLQGEQLTEARGRVREAIVAALVPDESPRDEGQAEGVPQNGP